MCTTCGCAGDGGVRVLEAPPEQRSREIALEQRILAKNDALAAANRERLSARGIFAVNLMSSPGSGKTTILERAAGAFAHERPVSVIEGDQETALDADRIRATGCQVVQINTGAGCHLDADMTRRGLDALDPPAGALLFIENVGNLVCPALFALGEDVRVVVMSVTEGADKPLKYPHIFGTAQLVLLNKVDLLPYVDFDLEAWSTSVRRVNPSVDLLGVSATRGDGLDEWYAWLRRRAISPA